MQQSEVRSTKNGVQALEMAYTGITKIKQDVEATRFNLASGYKGSDGQAFQDLVNSWEQQADVILKNLQDMVDKLNQTLTAQHQQQGSSNDQINQGYQQAQAVFNALHG
ncbi:MULTISPECIES: WXG100 family type VII secretion target [Actinoallomurus]|uniref:WXG100 family type VII secretion target n=1 Tax=Actinoallomurus purpureus TaxID=478114 RepID=UPI0020936718|nr:WXG100 family type VII secretion target [Actinoallomurus purpureus]MCO6008481.1 WXG100 family type VII secretion target [Actinoallomurus purpureus]